MMGGLSNVATEAGAFEFSCGAKTGSLFTPIYDTVKESVFAELKRDHGGLEYSLNNGFFGTGE